MDGRNKVEKKNMMEQKEKKEGEGEWGQMKQREGGNMKTWECD